MEILWYNFVMRRARITYEGAFHHVMNRGIEGQAIFAGKGFKDKFIEILSEKKEKLKIRLFSYCVMDNHYHLVLENTGSRMADFMKQLNGQYGTFYRKQVKGKGYVFQNRFKSILIQDTTYLQMAIAYVLRNPVRTKITSRYDRYKWSSGQYYFSKKKNTIIETNFVNDLFENQSQLEEMVKSVKTDELPVVKTKYGHILGKKNFLEIALKEYNRREERESSERQRVDDRYFEPLEKIYQEFEKIQKISIDDINIRTFHGKRLRGELLVLLKDLGGLKYSEIIKLDIFSDLQLNSLGSIYKNAIKSRG